MWGSAAPDMSAWLGRKYAILQQQANAADTQNKNQKIGIVAAAGVDNARAALIPKQGMADIAKTNAETGLVGEQTRWFGPTAQAGIANTNANTRLTGFQGDFLFRQELEEAPGISPAAVARAKARRLPTMGSFGGMGALSPVADTRTRMSLSAPSMSEKRRVGETEAAWLDRINGF